MYASSIPAFRCCICLLPRSTLNYNGLTITIHTRNLTFTPAFARTLCLFKPRATRQLLSRSRTQRHFERHKSGRTATTRGNTGACACAVVLHASSFVSPTIVLGVLAYYFATQPPNHQTQQANVNTEDLATSNLILSNLDKIVSDRLSRFRSYGEQLVAEIDACTPQLSSVRLHKA